MKADKNQVKRRLNIIRGQVDGVLKMVEEDAYCIDVSNQLLAIASSLKSVNQLILSAHLEHCVKHAQGEELEQKLNEVQKLLERL